MSRGSINLKLLDSGLVCPGLMYISELVNGLSAGIFCSIFISPDRIGGFLCVIILHGDIFSFTSRRVVMGAFFKHLIGTFFRDQPTWVRCDHFFHRSFTLWAHL